MFEPRPPTMPGWGGWGDDVARGGHYMSAGGFSPCPAAGQAGYRSTHLAVTCGLHCVHEAAGTLPGAPDNLGGPIMNRSPASLMFAFTAVSGCVSPDAAGPF